MTSHSHEGRVHTTIADATERDHTVYGTAVGKERSNYAASVAELLGPSATLTPATSVNLDLRRGAVHTTTGIPHAIGGTATVVSQKVGLWLASFPDPIKAILGVGVHRDEKIIIKRKYCVGGGATIVPERAPARTVAIQEDVREVTLTRYGGDIEMNLNLFLTGEAEEELEMKLDCQKRELERTLVDIGYRMLLREGTLITDALIRSNPTYDPQDMDGIKYRVAARNMYESQIFGAINKFRFPVANLLAAAKYASAYSTCTQKGSVMILPHGVPELTTIARKERMEYNVSGLQNNSKITMALDGGFTDPNSGVDILIHYPTPTYENGAANPTVNTKTCSLSDVSYILTVHCAGDKFSLTGTAFPDSNKGVDLSGLKDMTAATAVGPTNGEATSLELAKVFFNTTGRTSRAAEVTSDVTYPDLMNGGVTTSGTDTHGILRIAKVSASSAILAAPGDSTGQLLIGYPFTGVSTSHAEERMRIQLRCYLGACLYQPDAVMILPNVFINGISNIETYEIPSTYMADFKAMAYALQMEEGFFATKDHAATTDLGVTKDQHEAFIRQLVAIGDSTEPLTTSHTKANYRLIKAVAALYKLKTTGELPVFKTVDKSCEIPRGTSYSGDDKEYQNVAAFGRLDDPVHYIGCHGVPQTYEGGKWDM